MHLLYKNNKNFITKENLIEEVRIRWGSNLKVDLLAMIVQH
jgi:hypothetical protein